jgi:hypothetical protein
MTDATANATAVPELWPGGSVAFAGLLPEGATAAM